MAESRRVRKGGSYQMDNVSFGAMMISEQVRNALNAYSTAIKEQARQNTNRAGTVIEQGGRHGGRSMADAYEVEKGPIMILVVDGKPSPRITNRVVNRSRHAAIREFGRGGWTKGKGTRALRRAGESFGDLAGERG